MDAAFGIAVLLLQTMVVAIGVLHYIESFLGYGWDEGGRFLVAAYICGTLASIPTAIRDHRFFKKYWGFGLIGIRNRFPFQMFPARQDQWLNPLAWWSMAILFLHLFWLVLGSASDKAIGADTHANLRYMSLMVTFVGLWGALAWEYPPTEMPQAVKR